MVIICIEYCTYNESIHVDFYRIKNVIVFLHTLTDEIKNPLHKDLSSESDNYIHDILNDTFITNDTKSITLTKCIYGHPHHFTT
jgi:hypothetical protein